MKISFALFFLLSTTLLYSQKPQLVVPTGHTGVGTAIALSPDGKYLLSGNSDKTCILWELQSNREIRKFVGHEKEVASVAFAPDGQKILTASYGGEVILWDIYTGAQLKRFNLDNGEKRCSVVFSPDGKFIVAGGDSENRAVLWDVQTWKRVRFFEGHTAEILDIALSRNDGGKFLLTGGGDSSTILWNTNTGQMVRKFEGQDGSINCIAFSPDGKYILTGSTTEGIGEGDARLWDVASGAEIHKFDFPVDGISGLAYSPDGKDIYLGTVEFAALYNAETKERKRSLGSAFAFKKGVFHYTDREKFLLIGTSETTLRYNFPAGNEYGIPDDFIPSKSNITTLHSAVFSSDGTEILTGHEDRAGRIWDIAPTQELSVLKEHLFRVTYIGQSPDKKYYVTANERSVQIWDTETKKSLLDFSEGFQDIKAVAISPACPDDRAGGRYILTAEPADSTVRLWNAATGKERFTFPTACRIQDVAFSPDGKYALAGGDKCIELWDIRSGENVQTLPTDYTIKRVAFAADSKHVLLGHEKGVTLVELPSNRLIRQFNHPLNALSVSPDGKYLAAGGGSMINVYEEGEAETDHSVQIWDLQTGNKMHNLLGHTLPVESIAYSPPTAQDPEGGKYLLTTSYEKYAKLWNAHTGEELATLLVIDDNDWVVTTPHGHFDASPGSMRLLYYVVGLEVVELEQLKERYYEPNLLQKLLGLSTEPIRTLSGFDTIALYPAVRLQLDTTQNKLHIRLQPRNGGTGKVSVFINGKEIIPDANPEKGYEKIRDTAMTIELERFQNYFLFDSLNVISVRAYNQAGWLKSAAKSVAYRPAFARSKGEDKSTGSATTRSLNRKPALFAVVVGTADYAGSQLDLKYSAKDAQDMAAALEQIGGQLFEEHVSVQLLSTDTSLHAPLPTKANIRAAFEKIKSRAKAEDILVVYFSGHGVSYGDADQALFYYLTMDIGSENLSDAGVRAGRTVSSEELTRWINDIPAQKQVLVLDACNSGRVVENLAAGQKELSSSQIRALDRMKDRTGMFVLTGSAADKVSYEAGQYGQGLLTYSLLQGMSGLALTADKRVDVSTLFEYARDIVPQLAKGIGGVQTPMMVGPLHGSFDIGLVNEKVKIPLAQVKPVFIRNVFQDEERFDDTLGLTKALSAYFQEITVRGAQADLIYVDVSEYPNAYSIKGLYSISGNEVTVRGRLFQGKTTKGEFTVTGKKSELQALVEALVDKVSGML